MLTNIGVVSNPKNQTIDVQILWLQADEIDDSGSNGSLMRIRLQLRINCIAIKNQKNTNKILPVQKEWTESVDAFLAGWSRFLLQRRHRQFGIWFVTDL